MEKFIFKLQRFAEFNNASDNQNINGTDESDSITNSGNNVTINAAAGDDAVYNNGGASVYISLGDGNDYLESSGANSTIIGGKGNDRIWLSTDGSTNTQINYTYGDGNDVIYYFTGDDKIVITSPSGVNKSQSDNDIYLWFDNRETITLKSADSAVTNENILVIGSSGSDSYTYSGGNMIIPSYAGEKINFSTTLTGIDFNDTDFILKSSTGNLTIQNARDKIIDVATGGNTIAYMHMSSGAGKFDGSTFSVLELLVGANNAENELIAGSGGSLMWGGVGGNDTLVGGYGLDNYFFGNYDGGDVINNSYQNDTIFLYDVNLSDIAAVSYGTNQVNLNFSSGGNLQVNSIDNYSPTFQLANGSKVKCDTHTQAWQNA